NRVPVNGGGKVYLQPGKEHLLAGFPAAGAAQDVPLPRGDDFLRAGLAGLAARGLTGLRGLSIIGEIHAIVREDDQGWTTRPLPRRVTLAIERPLSDDV